MAAGIVVVGGGECGARAAFALREGGYEGPVTLIGRESHLPYERPPLSKDSLKGDAIPEPRTVAEPGRFEEADIRLVVGDPAAAIDPRAHAVMLGSGKQVRYERLLMATGAVPRHLSLPGADPADIAYLRSIDDARVIWRELRAGRSLAVIGGGFIGLELAATARSLGVEVTLVEIQPRLLSRGVPPEIASELADRHRLEGVDLILGTGIAGLETENGRKRLALADGRRIEADLIVAGIGAVPDTALAAESGLAIDNGIAVDDRLRTSAPDILAAGDCCSFPHPLYDGRRIRLEAWRNAHAQGELAARNLMGADEPVSNVPSFWSDQYDLSLHMAGLSDEGVTTVRRETGAGTFILFHLAADGRLVAASGIGPGNSAAKDIRLAEMLIARRACPDPTALAASDVNLKTLLSAR